MQGEREQGHLEAQLTSTEYKMSLKKVTWTTAKYGDPHPEFVLCI